MTEAEEEALMELYEEKKHDLRIFMNGVLSYVGEHPELTRATPALVHSFKARLKDSNHLKQKIRRKVLDGSEISPDNFFRMITDPAGVRILHLFQHNFSEIDSVIRRKIGDGDWVFAEQPKAYTWDPEAAEFFARFDLNVSEKVTSYTSVHYLIRPREDSPLCCELQVRTLFEEIWGEVDHQINYPVPTSSVACREQLKVLSKVTGAGSRLLDALTRIRDVEG